MTDIIQTSQQTILDLKKEHDRIAAEMKNLMKKEMIEHKNSNTFTRSLVISFRCNYENINRTQLMQNSDGTWSFFIKGNPYAKFDDQLLYDDPTVSKVLFANGNTKYLKELLIKIGLCNESDHLPFGNYVKIGIIRKAEMQGERTRNNKPLFKLTVDVNEEPKKTLNDYHACLIATDASCLKMKAFLEYGYEPDSNIMESFVHCMSVAD